MTNDLTTLGNSAQEINKLFGFTGARMKPSIPVLKINGADDDEGTTAPKGTFVLDDGDKVLYTETVKIRSFKKAYQYRLFDKDDKTKSDMSAIEEGFKGEFRSTSGRLACGKMNKKSYAALGSSVSAIQKYLQDNVKCKLLVFGLVSGTFTDLDTKASIEVKDELFHWVVPQSGFIAIDQAITGIEKERRAVPLTPIQLKLKKEKYGQVTYFVPMPEVLPSTEQFELERDKGYVAEIAKFIADTNTHVNARYNEATKQHHEDSEFANVGEILEGKAKPIANDPLDSL